MTFEEERVFRFSGESPERLDHFLVACLPEFSRARLQGFIKGELVQVNGAVIQKTGYQLENGAEVRIAVPPTMPSTLIPEDIPLDVVFENKDLLVVNKPAGMVVHPAAGHSRGTLVHAVLAHAPDITGVGGEQRPGIVHRLDKNTSGLIVIAKNDAAHHHLQRQFSTRQVEKTYLALVDGAPPTPVGRVEAAIGRDAANRKRMAVVVEKKGRMAVSEYKILESFKDHSYLEVKILTGRTHQIRLHMAFLGCPVAGDSVYGRRHPTVPLDRHFLHAARLVIKIPGAAKPGVFEAPLPPELQEVLDSLRA